MYNLQFDRAHQDFDTWERLHPDDPLGPVSQAAGYLFAEFARFKVNFEHTETDCPPRLRGRLHGKYLRSFQRD